MEIKLPQIQYLNIDVDGNPLMIEEVTALSIRYGQGIKMPVVAALLVWNFKVFETTNKNKLLIDSEIHQEYRFEPFVKIVLEEVKEAVLGSYNESRDLFHKKLRENDIMHQAKDLPEASLRKYARRLFDDLKKRQ